MTFVLGLWKAQCDRCGFDYKSNKLRLEWTGLRVCDGAGTNGCWESRHPQDKLRGRKEAPAPAWTRPDGGGEDVSPGSGNEVTPDDL